MTETINLMPEPGTEQYFNMLRWMREAYADPRNVNFRREVTRDGANLQFLTQGGSLPLPEVTDPLRKAIEVPVTLLVSGTMDDPADFMEELAEALKHVRVEAARWNVIDVLIPDDPKEVSVLDEANYREGDHFTNPIREA